MKKYLLAATILGGTALLSSQSLMATAFYKSAGGAITKSDEGTFAKCGKKVFRDKGSSGLSPKIQKKLIVAKFTGGTIEDLAALISKMKSEDLCTYGEDGEKFN